MGMRSKLIIVNTRRGGGVGWRGGVATSARPRFLSRAGVITGDFVTEDAGCGVVHCAPAFGEEDYKARYSPLGLLRRPLSTRATPP